MSGVNLESPVARRILAALAAHGPMHAHQIADTACCAASSLIRGGYLRALVAAEKIHVERWLRAYELDPPRSGEAVKVYAIGPGKNAPCPKRLSNSKRCKRARATPAGKATEARWRAIRGGLRAVDPILAALMMPLSTNAARVAAEGAEA